MVTRGGRKDAVFELKDIEIIKLWEVKDRKERKKEEKKKMEKEK